MKQDRYIDRFIAKFQPPDDPDKETKAERRERELRLATWQQFASWASPVLQWMQIYIPEWLGKPFSELHSDMLQHIFDCWMGRMPKGKRRGVVVSPRSHAKSTCGKGALLYLMTEGVATGQYKTRQGQDYDMMVITGDDDLAKQMMAPVWEALKTNKRILCDYGELLPDRPKEGLDAQLRNGFRIFAAGKNTRLLGNHPQLMLMDDAEDRENISSDQTREKFRQLWWETLDPMMVPGTYPVIVGNYTHMFCFLRQIALDAESHTMIRSALVTKANGQVVSAWPAMHPTETLIAKQESKPFEFSTLYMNKPMMRTESPVGLEDIYYYDNEDLPEEVWRDFDIVTMTDPAISQKERGCETAIVTVGGLHKNERSEIYVLDIRAAHWKDSETIAQQYLLYNKYHPNHQGIEDMGFQQMYKTMSELSQDKPMGFMLDRHNCYLHGKDKIHRLRKAADHMDLVRFKRGDPLQERGVDQLVSYQVRDRFDIGDAICMAVNEYMRIFPHNKGNLLRSPQYVPIYDRTGRIIGSRQA